MKILIVDDEPEIVSILIRWISTCGHDAFGITGGADVISWVQKQGFDVVLLDIRLPDADGLSIVADLVAKTKAKIIVMSGLPEDTWIETAMRNGAHYWLTKPLSFSRLEEILTRLQRTNFT